MTIGVSGLVVDFPPEKPPSDAPTKSNEAKEKKPPGRLFFIPDIHGRNDLLQLLLTDVLPHQAHLDLTQDKLIFGGDMVDRGPNSRQVVETIKQLTEFYANVIALFGNHERMMVDACAGYNQDKMALWLWNGGAETLKSYGAISSHGYGSQRIHEQIVDKEHLRWVGKLPLSHEEPGFFFSHAPAPRENRRGLNRGAPFTEAELTWTYSPDEFGVARDFGAGVVGVCGHIHQLRRGCKEPRFYDHYIFGDAGCGCHPAAPLVAIEVRTREVFYARPTPGLEEV